MRTLIFLATVFLAAATARAQSCPDKINKGSSDTSKDSVLHGTLQVHDDLRQWIGIKLDAPTCDQAELQLIFSKAKAYRIAETMRECAVTVTGELFDSPTGYYSADIAISDAVLKPDASCHPAPLKRDPQPVPLRQGLQVYHASITVDYRGRGHVDVKVWQGEEKRVSLTPWESYVSYSLTGGQDVIWFDCQKALKVNNITQTPDSPNSITDDQPFLTGATLQDLKGVNVISFTCQKNPLDTQRKKASSSAQRDPK